MVPSFTPLPRRATPEDGPHEHRGWPTVVFVVGLLLTAVLVAKGVKGAILIGIVVATALSVVLEAVFSIGPRTTPGAPPDPAGWGLVVPAVPTSLVEAPDLSLLGRVDLLGAFGQIAAVAAVLLVFTLLLADFFDTMGTVVGVGGEAGLLDEDGDLPGVERVLVVDSLAAVAGGLASTSSSTTYVESAAGVGEGARTGLTIVVMPFTCSISAGIGAGFVSSALIALVTGRARTPHPLLWLVAVLFVVYFAIAPIRALLGVG